MGGAEGQQLNPQKFYSCVIGNLKLEGEMMTATPPRPSANPPLPLVDNPSAPEIFASECVGLYLQGGNIHLTFANPHANHSLPSASPQKIISARLIIPAQSAQNLAANLYSFLKKNGLDPVPIPDKSKIQ